MLSSNVITPFWGEINFNTKYTKNKDTKSNIEAESRYTLVRNNYLTDDFVPSCVLGFRFFAKALSSGIYKAKIISQSERGLGY